MALLVGAIVNNPLKALGLNQESLSYKMNVIPFLCASILAILLWMFRDPNTRMAIILS
jgi:hypothetical protein